MWIWDMALTSPAGPALIAEPGGQLLHIVRPGSREKQDLTLRTHLSSPTGGQFWKSIRKLEVIVDYQFVDSW